MLNISIVCLFMPLLFVFDRPLIESEMLLSDVRRPLPRQPPELVPAENEWRGVALALPMAPVVPPVTWSRSSVVMFCMVGMLLRQTHRAAAVPRPIYARSAANPDPELAGAR